MQAKKRIPLDQPLEQLADEYRARVEGNHCAAEEWSNVFDQVAEVVSEGDELFLEIEQDEE